MKKIIVVLGVLMTPIFMNAQVARWLIPNQYESIHLDQGANIIITDSAGYKILWTYDGKRITKTEDDIFAYKDGMAVSVKKNTEAITGFYNSVGRHVSLENFKVAHSYPFFSNNRLLVTDGVFYRYVNETGVIDDSRYTKAYPFSNGYASCYTYENLEKRKSPYYLLLNKNMEMMKFSFNGKSFDTDDINFISSVNDENIGIVVIKRKVYFFNGKELAISPVYANPDETNIKNQGKIDGDLEENFISDTDTSSILSIKCGKSDFVKIKFDKYLRPIAFISNDKEKIYKQNNQTYPEIPTPLIDIENERVFGLNWEDIEVFPPQFQRIGKCFENKAFVKLSGKYGMLEVFKDKSFGITLNKGNDVPFRHQKFETKLRIDIPTEISAQKTIVEVDPKFGCEVDMTSKEWKDTEYGNYVEYNCVLNIPNYLPDDIYEGTRNEIVYPMNILYDGLKSPVIPFKIKAWHYKYLTADINENERTLQKGMLSFTFDINADRIPGEDVYPISVRIKTDSVIVEPEKISESRYKCRDLYLYEGVNNVVIQINEQGCPPMQFPYEIEYIKPSSKKSKSGKEEVVFKKKVKATPPPTPHWDI